MKLSTRKNRVLMSGSVLLFVLVTSLLTTCNRIESNPVGITFVSPVFRSGDNGDNWCVIWAGDGDLYTSQCDGRGWRYEDGNQRDFMNNQIWHFL